VGAVADRTRGPVLAALAEALGAALDGRGGLVLLTGEAGIGKTTTASALADRARRAGATVRWAACWPGGATVAHGPWLTVLAGLAGPGRAAIDALAANAPDDGAAAASQRASAYAAVADAVEESARERPLVVVVDDLHWADEGTVQLLGALAGRLPAFGALVVGTYRDTDVGADAPLRRLGASADRLALRGLDADEVAAVLADSLGPARAGELAPEVVEQTGGNPFLVMQLGRLVAADPDALRRGALPVGARDLLGGRLAVLEDDERGVVVAAAVLGGAFTVDVLRRVAGDGCNVDGALDRAAALRIVERAPGVGAWRFVHDLFRTAALDAIASTELAALHARAADALGGDAGAEPAVVARHVLAAGGDAAPWFVRAGERALAAMAWEEAAAEFEHALAVSRGRARVPALLGLGRARVLNGDPDGAGRAFDEVASLARDTGETRWLVDAALGFSADLSGFEVRLFDQRQIDLLEEAAAALAGDDDPASIALRSTVTARLSVALSLAAPTARRLTLAEDAVALARESGDRLALARALAAHCDAIAGPDDVARREAEASEIIAIAEKEGDGPLELLGRRLRYVARLESGDVAGANDDAGAFERRARAIGNPLYTWYADLWRGAMAVVVGDDDTAETLGARVAAVGRATGSANASMLAVVLDLIIRWARGDNAGAVERMGALTTDYPEVAVFLSSVGANARALALAGYEDAARVLVDRTQAIGLDATVRDAEWLPNIVTLLDTAVLLDHPSLADVLAVVEPYAGLVAFEGIGAGHYGSVARFVALACVALGRRDDAVAYARVALDVNRRFGGRLAAEAERTLAEVSGAPVARTANATGAIGELARDGDVWHVTFAGETTIVKHTKGVADLAVLLRAGGREVHVSELIGVDASALHAGGRGGDALDRRAVAAYRDRLAELAEEIDDADAAHDVARAERARVEHDALVEQLAAGLGLGGRARAAGPDPVERSRKAVAARIRDAIRRIDAVHPALGRHLGVSIKTGIFCSYRPEHPVVWRCEPSSGAGRA
jgi:hypothetical protein